MTACPQFYNSSTTEHVLVSYHRYRAVSILSTRPLCIFSVLLYCATFTKYLAHVSFCIRQVQHQFFCIRSHDTTLYGRLLVSLQQRQLPLTALRCTSLYTAPCTSRTAKPLRVRRGTATYTIIRQYYYRTNQAETHYLRNTARASAAKRSDTRDPSSSGRTVDA